MPVSIPSNTLEKFTTFGDLLRFLRRRAGITQMELSIAVGYSDTQISRLEQNLRLPDIPTIEARFIPALGLEEEPKAIARLLDLAANVRREDAPALGLCPYKGLNYFDEADADLFVGREALTAKLVERVLSLSSPSRTETRFLAVVGASGSGKSSLVRAGLVSALRWHKKAADWHIHVLTPTAHPLESLAGSLTHSSNSVMAIATLMDNMASDSRSLQIFAKRELRSGNNAHLLLVVDQFEELFALCRSEEERASFIDNLLMAASEVEGPTVIVITLRADFYAHCANYIQLREALAQNQEYIGAMNDQELRHAIEEPAQRGRWEFEPGLIDLLLHDVGHEPGALPLLSHALLETWQRRRGRTMTLSGYASSGGVRGAIAETAEAVFTDQFTHEQQVIARRIFLRLTELSDEASTADTRRRARFDELILKPEETNTTQAVLKALADARLITTSEDFAEVAHEALIREWPTLRGWLEDNREGLRLHRQLTEAAQEWSRMNREPDMLYRGVRLAQAYEWAKSHDEEMNALEREFLVASIETSECEAREREAQRQRELEAAQKLAEAERQRAEEQTRSAGQLRKLALYLTGAFILALVMALTALFFGEKARQSAVNAQTASRMATSRELAAAAIANLDADPERSILLALQAVKNADSLQAQDALHQAVQASRLLQSSYTKEGFGAASFSPDGTRLVIENGRLTQVRDAITLKVLFTVPGNFSSTQWTDVNHWPTISPSEAPNSSVITFWNATGEKISSAIVPAGIWSDTPEGWMGKHFSPDFTQIALGNQDGTVSIFDTKTGQQLHRVGEAGRPFPHFILFSPDGKLLLTGGFDTNEVTLWDIASGRALLNRQMDAGMVALAFSPDQKRFAISDGGTVTMIDMGSGEDLLRLPGSSGYADFGLRFNADGSLLVTVEADGSAHIWNTMTGKSVLKLSGVQQSEGPVFFSPDDMRLVTGSMFGTLQLWGLSPADSREWLTVSGARAANIALFTDRNACTCGVSFSPDNTRLAITNKDSTVKVLDSISGKILLTLEGDKEGTWSPVFSPDGTRIATANADNSVKLWDATTGKALLTLSGHTNWVNRITFSPDGTRLATISYDRTARLWDATSGELLFSQEVYPAESNLPTIGIDIAFSPDGTRFAAAGNNIVKAWEAATGKELFSLLNQSGPATTVAFSPDGTRLAVGYNSRMVSVFDATTGRKLFDLAGEIGSVTRIAYSPNGNYIAASLDNGITKLWDARTGSEQLTLTGHDGQVVDLAFSPDGTRLATVGTDETVRVYALRLEDLVKIAQSRISRSLTTKECQQYLHVEECPSTPW